MFGNMSILDIGLFFVSILIGMTIHEASHGYMAHLLGDHTAKDEGRLTLNPLKSIDLLTTILLPLVLVIFGLMPFFVAKPVNINPRNLKFDEFGLALVGLAGPISNFLLAVIAGIIFRLGVNSLNYVEAQFLVLFAEINISLFIFNLIPFPPLDGSRLLYALAPENIKDIMNKIESLGFISILIFMLLIFQFIATPVFNLELHILNFLL
ncbi:MAG: site-2 protease family protein [Patescibacteria group bacterium]|jgi:Zn-dependent proteases|nr:site-2 protease family protein [Patescibacteria group bacterium]